MTDEPNYPNDAACRAKGVDPAWFYPDRGEDSSRAKGVCAGCPVRRECLADAMAAGDAGRIGIWGGLSARQRQTLRTNARRNRLNTPRRCIRCGAYTNLPLSAYCDEADCLRSRRRENARRLRQREA